MPCRKCVDSASSFSRILLIFVVASVLCAYVARLSIYAARNPVYLHLYLLKIGVGYVTSMHVVGVLEEWELEPKFGDLAGLAHMLLSLFSWDGSLPLQVADIDCLFQVDSADAGHNLQGLLFFWAMLPVIWPLFAFILFLCIFEIVGFIKVGVLNQDQSTESKLSPPASPVPAQGSKKLAIQDGSSSAPPALSAIVPVEPASPVRIQGTKRWSFKRNTVHAASEILKHVNKPEKGKDTAQKRIASLLHEERFMGIWRKSAMELQFRERFGVFAEDSMSLVFVALFLAYPCVVKNLLQFLRCDILEGESETQLRLLLSPNLVCWTGEHLALLVPCITFFLIWAFGIPIAFWFLSWQQRAKLAEVRVKCRLGFLTMGFEPKYYYWELINFVRRLSLLLVAIAPSAQRTYTLAIWTTLGLLFLALHAILEPYDNRSGLLLDSLEFQHHLLFFGCTGVLLLIMTMDWGRLINFLLLLIGVGLNAMFIVRIILNYFAQIRRQVSDEWVETQRIRQRTARLNIGAKNPKEIKPNKGLKNFIRTRVFLLEVELQAANAQVMFSNSENGLNLKPGNSANAKQTKEVKEFERAFVAQGIADGLHHAIVDSNFERIDCHFMEFLVRQTFVWQADKNRSKLEAMKELKDSGMAPNLVLAEERRLSKQLPDPKEIQGLKVVTKSLTDDEDHPSTDDGGVSHTKSSAGLAFAASMPLRFKRIKQRTQFAPFFDDKTFAIGLSANDFQAEMSRIAERSKKKLEEDFHGFMLRKGIDKSSSADGGSPRQKLLSQLVTMRRKSKESVSPSNASMSLNAFMQESEEQNAQVHGTSNSEDANIDYGHQASAPMQVEDLEHPGDSSTMLTMTPGKTPPEGWARGVGFGDTILPSAISDPPLPPPPAPPGNAAGAGGLQVPGRGNAPKGRAASPAPPVPPPTVPDRQPDSAVATRLSLSDPDPPDQ